MEKNNKVFVVIPVHNRKAFTRACLECLKTQTVKCYSVVVDDGSTDGTGEMITNQFPDVILIKGDGNLWWTGATNLGVIYALENGADYIMTLNDDTLPSTDFIEKMLYWAEKKPKVLLGALAVDAQTGRAIYGGEKINWFGGQSVSLISHKKTGELKGIHEVSHFPGRGLLIPSDVFRQIGLYDQYHFPHYAADYDFTHRAIRAGFIVFCNYDAKLLIYPDASGSVQLKKVRSLGNYYKHLFGIKGAANLRVFTFYALKNCPKKYLPFFLTQGYVRRIFGYWL